jgi:hypothetical protein
LLAVPQRRVEDVDPVAHAQLSCSQVCRRFPATKNLPGERPRRRPRAPGCSRLDKEEAREDGAARVLGHKGCHGVRCRRELQAT